MADLDLSAGSVQPWETDPEAVWEVVLSTEAGLEAARAAVWKRSHRVWAQDNVITEAGQPITFDGRPYIQEIWDDCLSKQIVIQKPTQVGATVWGYCLALHRVVMHGKTVIYTMPTASDVGMFASLRLNKVIDNSPNLAAQMGRKGKEAQSERSNPRDNRGVKQMRSGGTLYLRGTVSKSAAISVPAHVLIHDEVDFSQPEALEMFEHRLDALVPSEREIYRLSTPTVEGYGISALFEASDGHCWLVRCETPGCGWEGVLDYWEHTEGTLLYLRCTRCGGKLDPVKGRWVPLRPPPLPGGGGPRRARGYKLSRLMKITPDETGEEEAAAIHRRRMTARFKAHFYNMDLGETSSEGTARITREEILGACFLEAYPFQMAAQTGTGPYYMGVDQGDTLTVVVARADPRLDSGKLRIVALFRLRDPSRGSGSWGHAHLPDGKAGIGLLMDLFKVRLAVVDANPNSAASHDFAKAYPGRVFLCYYGEGQRTQISESPDIRNRYLHKSKGQVRVTERVDITVDRTETLDRTATDLVGGLFMLPSPYSHVEIDAFIRHCEANIRRPEEKADGTVTNRWIRTDTNDYFHACNYVRIAYEESLHLSQLKPAFSAPIYVKGIAAPRRM